MAGANGYGVQSLNRAEGEKIDRNILRLGRPGDDTVIAGSLTAACSPSSRLRAAPGGEASPQLPNESAGQPDR